ncbi:N-6 DNA methylase [Streptomyces asoensis]|uniref:N-6 DNA methylase n=1 Tax=Streptomyces asoensis TaxID=249586 RepID=A0A6M4WTS7_9ACTN|nr:N-6 DNA methylase [Streptomyces asoensis]QJT03071.1 N-6 DNA methylase [Streptomyces asoensis]
MTRSLAGRLSAQDASRVVIGLIYLRNTAREQPSDVWGRSEKPSWSWLVAQTGKDRHLGPHVRWCLSEWLPEELAREDADARRDFVPALLPAVDGILRKLVVAIDQVDRVGDLLERCLEDLSAVQAKGGHYFTPRDLVRLLVASAAPQSGHRVLDPVCGSAGLLAEADRQVRERTGLRPKLELTGRDIHAGTLQIAQLNLAARGIRADLGTPVDSLGEPPGGAYDIVLANPPFNMTPWYDGSAPRGDDPRWPEPLRPPRDSANFAWILHFAHALAPQGRASFVMADGAAASARRLVEKQLRRQLVQDDLVECVVALPPGLFPHTRISCCLWLLNRDKSPHRGWGEADRRRQVLFVDARRAYELAPGKRQKQRRLAADGTGRILRTLAAWRATEPSSGEGAVRYEDAPNWCASRSSQDIADAEFSLLPAVYTSEDLDEDTSVDQRVDELTWELYTKFEEAQALESELRRALDEL